MPHRFEKQADYLQRKEILTDSMVQIFLGFIPLEHVLETQSLRLSLL